MPTIHDYFQRACQRDEEPLEGVAGERCFDADGNSARFWLVVKNGRITAARFQCTTCCTLVGLCEHAAELLPGWTLHQAGERLDGRLLALHPEVPGMRQNRAVLVADAIQSAALRARMEAYA